MTENPFIARLRELAAREDRGALAALRRGLGKPPGSAAEMHPHVAPFLPDEAWTWRNQCLYIVAAVFGLHPAATTSGNMGHAFRGIKAGSESESIEKHFIALLKCHRDDLFDHLRHAVSLAKAKDLPVNWEQLLKDIRNWDSDDAWVQRQWSQAFWGADRAAGETTGQDAEAAIKEKQA